MPAPRESIPPGSGAFVIGTLNLGLTLLGLITYVAAFHVDPPYLPFLAAFWLLVGWIVAGVLLVCALGRLARGRDPGATGVALTSCGTLLVYVVLFVLVRHGGYAPIQ